MYIASDGIVMRATYAHIKKKKTWINNNISVIRKHNDYEFISIITLTFLRSSFKLAGFSSICIVVCYIAEWKRENNNNNNVQELYTQTHTHTSTMHICFRRFVDFYGSNNQLIARIYLFALQNAHKSSYDSYAENAKDCQTKPFTIKRSGIWRLKGERGGASHKFTFFS